MREKTQIILRLGTLFVLMISLVQCDGLFGLFGEEEKEKCIVGATLPCECMFSGTVTVSSQVCGLDGEFGECECDSGRNNNQGLWENEEGSSSMGSGGAFSGTFSGGNNNQGLWENEEDSSSVGSGGSFTGTFQLP